MARRSSGMRFIRPRKKLLQRGTMIELLREQTREDFRDAGARKFLLGDSDREVVVTVWLRENVALYDEATDMQVTGNVVDNPLLAQVCVMLAAAAMLPGWMPAAVLQGSSLAIASKKEGGAR